MTLVIIQNILNGKADISHIRLFQTAAFHRQWKEFRHILSGWSWISHEIPFSKEKNDVGSAELCWEGRKENSSSKRSTPLCRSKSVEVTCLDTTSFNVFGVILTKVLYDCLWTCIIFLSSSTNSTEASDVFCMKHKCNAMQSSGSTAVSRSLLLPRKERTAAVCPSVMEAGSAVAHLSEMSLP